MTDLSYVGGPRKIQQRWTLAALWDWMGKCNDAFERKALLKYITENYGPREIYECNHWLTGINHQIPDGHVRFALEAFQCEPYYPVRMAATNLLVDGWVLWKLDEEEDDDFDPEEYPDRSRVTYIPGKWVLEDPHIIRRAEFRNEELREVEMEYEYEREINNSNEYEVWVYNATFTKQTYGQTLRIIKWRKADGIEGKDTIREYPNLAVWPYLGFQWETQQSILTPVIATICRYEMCLQNIAHENDRHTRRKAVYTGTYKLEKSPMLMSSDEEREHLPENASKTYPDTHPEGLGPMFEERKILEDEIRQNVGLIKVYPLHNASGTSREIEIRPQLSQAMALRQRVVRMMSKVDPDCHIHFGPLEKLPPQELDMWLAMLEKAWLEGSVTSEEYTSTKRMMLGFPEVPLMNKHAAGAPVANMAITKELVMPQPKALGTGK